MDNNKCFLDLFKCKKPIMGMIHLKGSNEEEILEVAIKEIDLLLGNGVDAVIIENYFGTEEDVARVLEYLQRTKSEIIYGVNVLDNDEKGFEYAKKYGAKFIQLDSVAGHLTIEEDAVFHEKITEWRNECDAFVMGGVRFKYQPYKSGRSLEEDLKIGMTRCDAIVVTGVGTGQETSMDKIKNFREIIKDFPLIVGAGMTPENCNEQLSIADGSIVGSYLKDTYKDNGNVDKGHVKKFIDAVEACR